jgi:hypothetical protein
MRKGLLGSLLILLAGTGLALGQAPAASETASAPQTPASGAADQKTPAPPAPSGMDTHPWNPPVGHGNVWPYLEPLQAGTPECGPDGYMWLVPEYLLWGIKGLHLPPLMTTGTAVLGAPDLSGEAFSGGRFTAGTWLNDDHTCGFEGGYFFLGERTERSDASSAGGPGSPLLARPFIDVRTGLPASLVVAGPGLGAGKVRTSAESSLQGARADLVYEAYCCQPYRVELVGGFRYQDLAEEVNVGAASPLAPGGDLAAVVDQVHTRNVFFGGELGARAEYCWGHLVGTLSANLALGSNQETIRVVGSTVEATRRGPAVLAGGLLALPSNSGRFHDGEFSAVPELGLQLGYQFNPAVRVFVGYTFLYWSDVARPGDQLDLGINPTQAPALRAAGRLTGPVRPVFAAQETDFWAQGLNVGAEFRY